jgi:cell division protein FtsW
MSIIRSLIILVVFLFAIGLILIFNASSADVLDHGADLTGTHAAVLKQISYALLGVFFAAFLYGVGYHWLVKYSTYILIGLSVLLLCVFIPGIGMSANGARRWIKIAGLSMQPSEFVKLAVPLFYVQCYLVFLRIQSHQKFLKSLAFLAIPLVLILLEPNNGTVGVILLSLFVLLFLTGIEMKYWAIPALTLIILGGTFAMSLPYVRKRIEVFLHPENDLKGKGHQPYQAKIASGSGGLLGKGPGKSMQKLSYLPEAQNDYIAAIYAEEYGFIGIAVLIVLYGLVAYLGFYIAFFAADTAGFLLAASCTFLIAFQAFLNLAVVSGLLPSTGLNLPFFSQGGSSLIANFGIIGLLANIRKTAILKTNGRQIHDH